MSETFSYSSDNNVDWVNKQKIKKIIEISENNLMKK